MATYECFEFCPKIAECRESLLVDTQTPAPSGLQETVAKLDHLVSVAADMAVNYCVGPQVTTAEVQKGGYSNSKKIVERDVYACGRDGYTQGKAFYYQKDKTPPSSR